MTTHEEIIMLTNLCRRLRREIAELETQSQALLRRTRNLVTQLEEAEQRKIELEKTLIEVKHVRRGSRKAERRLSSMAAILAQLSMMSPEERQAVLAGLQESRGELP